MRRLLFSPSFLLVFMLATAPAAPTWAAAPVPDGDSSTHPTTCSQLLGLLKPTQKVQGTSFTAQAEAAAQGLVSSDPVALQGQLLAKIQAASSSTQQWSLLASYLQARGFNHLFSVLSEARLHISPRPRLGRKPIQWTLKRGQPVLRLWKPHVRSSEDLQKHLWLFADALFQLRFQRGLWTSRGSLPKNWIPTATSSLGISKDSSTPAMVIERILQRAKITAVDLPLKWQEERLTEMAQFEDEMYALFQEVQSPRLRLHKRDPGRKAWTFMFGLDAPAKAAPNAQDFEVWKTQGRAGVSERLWNRYRTPLLLSWYLQQVRRASLVYFTAKILIAATVFSVNTMPDMIQAYHNYQEIQAERQIEREAHAKNGDGDVIINDRYMSQEYEMALQRRDQIEQRLAELNKDPAANAKEISTLQVELNVLIQQYFS